MPKIIAENLTMNYKDGESAAITALNGLNAEFPSGMISCVIGLSGSGKTTLLYCLAGLYPYSGEITFDNRSVDALKPSERGVSLVSQEYALYPHFTVYDNIAFPLKALGMKRIEIDARVKKIAAELDLALFLSRKPRQLSGGQMQRVALARALVKRPSVLLLDEPLSNVDPQMRFQERRYIKKAVSLYGSTVVYVTHDVFEATALGDKLFLLAGGKIALCGDPAEVYNSDHPVMAAIRAGSEAR